MRGRILSRVDQGAERRERSLQPIEVESQPALENNWVCAVFTRVMSRVIFSSLLHGVLRPACRPHTLEELLPSRACIPGRILHNVVTEFDLTNGCIFSYNLSPLCLILAPRHPQSA